MFEPTQRTSLLDVSLDSEPPCLFLKLRGELDLSSAALVPLDEHRSRRDLTMVLVDLGELTFCDVTGFRALLAFRTIHEAQGRPVTLARANLLIWRLMGICGITDRLEYVGPANTLV